jgi:hypothetical protein
MIIVDIRQSDIPHAGKGFAAQMNACGILATDHTDIHGFNFRYAAIFLATKTHERPRKIQKGKPRISRINTDQLMKEEESSLFSATSILRI